MYDDDDESHFAGNTSNARPSNENNAYNSNSQRKGPPPPIASNTRNSQSQRNNNNQQYDNNNNNQRDSQYNNGNGLSFCGCYCGNLCDCCLSFYFPHTNPGKSGTYKGFFLLIVGILASIICLSQPGEIPNIPDFTSNCPEGYFNSCQTVNIVLRFSFALFCMFVLNAIGTAIFVPFYDMFWLAKYLVFCGFVVGFFFASSSVFDTNGYAWLARIGGFFFLIYQQIILIDFAHSWNENWVLKAAEDPDGSGRWYLFGLVAMSVLLISGSISMIGVMFWQFGGCSDTIAVISLTLILSILALLFQLFVNEHYSLMTSAIVFAYATYVCYAAVTVYPDSTCNPTLANSYQTLQQVVGMFILLVSMIWTTYSSTSDMHKALQESLEQSRLENINQAWAHYDTPGFLNILLEITLVYTLISCYYAMILTNWATFQQDNGTDISDPKVGYSSFWIQASAQWICLIMYSWTLVAPKLFPDRDFGGTV